MLQEAGLIEQKEGRLELTPKGLRKIGSNALRDLFDKLAKDKVGQHQMDRLGQGHERTYETKQYEYGDPFNLDLHNDDPQRAAPQRHRHAGAPLARRLRDRAHRAPHQVVDRVDARPVAVDADARQLPARQEGRDGAALADHVAVPRDYMGIVGFSETARILTAAQLPEVSWDFVYGTNMQHGFTARPPAAGHADRHQADHHDHRRRADGAHHADAATSFFNYPPVPETIEATLREVVRCTKDNIRINTFMLDANSYLKSFIEKLTSINRGRAFFTTPENARRLRAGRLHRAQEVARPWQRRPPRRIVGGNHSASSWLSCSG